MRRLAPLLPALLLLVAGCIQSPAAELTAASADAGPMMRWDGGRLVGAGSANQEQFSELACWSEACSMREPVACGETNCARYPFQVPAGTAAVVGTLRWPTLPDIAFDLWIEDASGARVARGTHAYPETSGLALRLEAPRAGGYELVAALRHGATDHQTAVRLESAREGTGALLPDLVTLPPTDLTLETPRYGGVTYFAIPIPGVREVAETLGSTGCRVDETAEYGHRRCLRFSNAVANLGEGALDVHLSVGQTQFVQRIHHADGTFEEHPGGVAEWHATHAHWHNAAGNSYTVHAYDATSDTIGDPLHEGRKGGICFADTGLVDVGLPVTLPPAESGWGCVQPDAAERDWAMGITPGWYDLYPYVLSDQYVDITGVPDGTYALCSVTNGDGVLAESDLTNNRSCTRFRLAGEEITLLDPAPYHTIPAESRI